jgi:hypothetical protein
VARRRTKAQAEKALVFVWEERLKEDENAGYVFGLLIDQNRFQEIASLRVRTSFTGTQDKNAKSHPLGQLFML